MGYKRRKRVYTLDFEDTDLDGLVVRATAPSLGELQELAGLDGDGEAAIPAMVEIFVRHARSWNLEDDDDNAVELTVEAFLAEGVDFCLPVIKTWMTGVVDVGVPLGGRSTSGPTFPEGSLPMVPLSRSQAS